ncbi:YhgE/Pip domain-containing protein [Secundilactobacillus mixtipabuli]|uniref:Phage infection protein n=1 Tax=Secundilactobacillus mixtipabuli TaxID=1435342 RepID=A0A1Z5I8Z8_9LACO|nr:YhgE/Pip domain-containing protein [Secundilactobacillus mixtipabuli]GAW98232.1 phage infection protein [Secundilactobacillus mixtipabuli]
MENIKAIYQRDLKAMLTSPLVIVMILALCILPSLYTLINVRAMWNPYDVSEIKNIPVAVVNHDTGASIAGKNLNVGKTVVKTLKEKPGLDWQFTSAEKADARVKEGKYYAEIIIPSNFSQSLASIASDNPHRAKLIYKANSRDAPMGGKITETAAKTLVSQVQTNFLETVNTTLFSKLNVLGDKAKSQQGQILALKDWIISLSDSMDLATGALGEINHTSTNMQAILTGLKPVMSASQNVDVLQQSNSATMASLHSVQGSVNKAFSSLNTNLNSATASANRLNSIVKQLNRSASSTNKSAVNDMLNRAISQVDLLKGQVTPLQSFLKSINGQSHLAAISGLNDNLGNVVSLLNTEKSQLRSLKGTLDRQGRLTSGDIASAANNTHRITIGMNSALSQYNSSVKTHLDGISGSLISAVSKSQSILGELRQAKGINEDYLNNAIQGNQLISQSSSNLESKLTSYQDDIQNIANQLKLTSNNDIVSVITVLQNNPKTMGNTLVSLFNVKNQSIYRVGTFGAAFLPTYVCLSIWIGCTMLVMILHTTIPREQRRFHNMTVHEEFCGKFLTFLTLSLIQTMIIIFSSILFLRVQVESVFIMVLFGVLSSLLFTAIIYGLAATFGNLGKAIVIFLVALQLAGSGALYPVQLDPAFYRVAYRLAPFAYSVGGFREAVGGPNMQTVFIDAIVLIMMFIVTFMLGYFLKIKAQDFTKRILSDFSRTGIGQ